MTYLIYSVQIEEEMRNREVELKLKLEKMMIHKVRCTWTLNVSASGSVIWLNGMEPGVPTNFNRTKISKHSVVLCEFVCFVQASMLPANFCVNIFLWQDYSWEEVKRHEEEVKLFHETYDRIVAEDRVSELVEYRSFWMWKIHFVKVHTYNFLVS